MNSSLSCRLCLATCLTMTALTGAFAQEQPLVPEDPGDDQPITRSDPLREAALDKDLLKEVDKPLPADETAWREPLEPVFSYIDGVAVNIVEQGAHKHRRARIRLTGKDQPSPKEPFRLMKDRAEHPEVYWGKAVALHGYLTELHEIPAPENAEDAETWYRGRLKIWNEDRTVRFVTRRLPEGLDTGEKLHEPATIIGYVFPLAAENPEQPEPLIVARWVRRLSPTIDPQSLGDIKDRAIGLPTDEEADAYYRVLLRAKLIDGKTQQEQAAALWKKRQRALDRPLPLFVDLFKQMGEDPSTYRGQSVTLSGTLRKFRELTIDPVNDYGIETLYEGWIFAEDSQSNPTVVVFTENAAQLPEGDDLNIPVKVTGYVFKMYGYQSRDPDHPLRVAPMLLANSMQKMSITQPEPFPVVWVGVAIGLLVVGIVLFLWTSHQKDKQFRQKTLDKDNEEGPPKFDQLDAE